jgi:hypothetical protein
MIINGHEAGPDLLNRYRRMAVYLYRDGGRIILMECDECSVTYHQWLSDDWQQLPEELQRKCLCLNCWTANLPL